jgi:hypothetical protein
MKVENLKVFEKRSSIILESHLKIKEKTEAKHEIDT